MNSSGNVIEKIKDSSAVKQFEKTNVAATNQRRDVLGSGNIYPDRMAKKAFETWGRMEREAERKVHIQVPKSRIDEEEKHRNEMAKQAFDAWTSMEKDAQHAYVESKVHTKVPLPYIDHSQILYKQFHNDYKKFAERVEAEFADNIPLSILPGDNYVLGPDIEVRLMFVDIRRVSPDIAPAVFKKFFDRFSENCFVLTGRSSTKDYMRFQYKYDKSQSKIDIIGTGALGDKWSGEIKDIDVSPEPAGPRPCPECGEQLKKGSDGKWRCKNGHVRVFRDYETTSAHQPAPKPQMHSFTDRLKYKLTHPFKKEGPHLRDCPSCGGSGTLIARYKVGNNTGKPDWYECSACGYRDTNFSIDIPFRVRAPNMGDITANISKIAVILAGMVLFYTELTTFGSGEYADKYRIFSIGGIAIGIVSIVLGLFEAKEKIAKEHQKVREEVEKEEKKVNEEIKAGIKKKKGDNTAAASTVASGGAKNEGEEDKEQSLFDVYDAEMKLREAERESNEEERTKKESEGAE